MRQYRRRLRKERQPARLMKRLADMRATSSCNLALAGETKAAISRHQMVRGGDGCVVFSCRAGHPRPADRGGLT
jgi:hypothetical protein